MRKLNNGEFILVAKQSSTNGSIDVQASTYTFDEENCGQALGDISSEFPNAGELLLVTGMPNDTSNINEGEITPEGNRVISAWNNTNPGVGKLSYPQEEELYQLVHNFSTSGTSSSSSSSSSSKHSHNK